MTGYIDLHLHTTRSDGSMSPAEIVMHAKYEGLVAIAITDHDTVSGNEEAILEGRRQGIRVIPGIELSISFGQGELHLLGYYMDYQNEELHKCLVEIRSHRKRRNPLIIQKLKNLGFDLNLQEIRRKANNGNVGRPHIAAAMVEANYVSSYKEAFDLYLRKNGPAYVPKEIMTVGEGISLIRRFGGIPVLAHPMTLDYRSFRDLRTFITHLAKKGLGGIEVYHPGASTRQIQILENIARQLDLCITGGSDFHGLELNTAEAGNGRGIARLPSLLLDSLDSARAKVLDSPSPSSPGFENWLRF
jgi:predicted metal-dependent phosphoesterase TrpH